MASTTKLLQLRTVYRPTTTSSPTSVRFFSSSSNTPEPNEEDSPQTNSASPQPPPPQSQSPFSSYFSDVKARLKQQQHGNPQSQSSGSPFGFSSPSSTSRIRDLEEIRKNLADFRHRSAVPPPSPPSSPSQSSQNISFHELYQRNVSSRGEESSSAGSKSVGRVSLDAIRERLHQIRETTPKTQNERIGRINDAMSLSRFKESLKLKPGDRSERDSPVVARGTDNLPLSIFGKEMREKEGTTANAAMKMDFVRIYRPAELGEKLRALRPEKKGKDWFSLEELNERLTKLRDIEERESQSKYQAGLFRDLKESLVVMQTAVKEKPKKPVQSLEILTQLGRTPSFMLSPPQEHLVEQYFHPDNMSASEKLKLELKKVRDEFKMSESDCGSARVQVAQLTTKIKHLSTVLHKKDKHSRKGLQEMVQLRKKLLKYLRRTDWDSYCFVLSKLGLRDNPDYRS